MRVKKDKKYIGMGYTPCIWTVPVVRVEDQFGNRNHATWQSILNTYLRSMDHSVSKKNLLKISDQNLGPVRRQRGEF